MDMMKEDLRVLFGDAFETIVPKIEATSETNSLVWEQFQTFAKSYHSEDIAFLFQRFRNVDVETLTQLGAWVMLLETDDFVNIEELIELAEEKGKSDEEILQGVQDCLAQYASYYGEEGNDE